MLHKIFNELFALNVFVARELILNAFNMLACGNCQTVQVVNSKKNVHFPNNATNKQFSLGEFSITIPFNHE